jgi:Tfp pilus assembly protein PilO
MTKPRMKKLNLEQEATLREKAIFAAAVVGLLILFISNLWSPMSAGFDEKRAEVAKVKTEVDSLQALLDAAKAQIAARASVASQPQKVDERVEKMLKQRYIDPLSEVHAAVALLSSRKVARRLKLENVSVGDTVDKNSYSIVPITFEFTGVYGAIQTFISAIENAEKPVLVRRFDLKQEGSGQISGTIEVELYVIKG